jgi:hypothetical protein
MVRIPASRAVAALAATMKAPRSASGTMFDRISGFRKMM